MIEHLESQSRLPTKRKSHRQAICLNAPWTKQELASGRKWTHASILEPIEPGKETPLPSGEPQKPQRLRLRSDSAIGQSALAGCLIAQPASGISAAGMINRCKRGPQTLSRIRMARHRRTFWLLAFTALLAGAPTRSPVAQPAQSATPAHSAAPQQTTATYEDWIVRCETLSGPPVRKSCEMVQYTQAQGGSPSRATR